MFHVLKSCTEPKYKLFLYEFHVEIFISIFPVLDKCELLCNDLREIDYVVDIAINIEL